MYKKIALLIFSVSVYIISYSQDSAFQITPKKEVIWVKIFNTTESFEDLFIKLKKTGYFVQIDTTKKSIIGELKKAEIDYSNSKETFWKSEIPIYIKMCDITATCEIDFKPGKYRVTLNNIKLIGKKENPRGSLLIPNPDEEHNLSYFALKYKKLEFYSVFTKYSSVILNRNFINKFTVEDTKPKDW